MDTELNETLHNEGDPPEQEPQEKEKEKEEECQELKNIQYKTLLMKGTTLKDVKSSNNLENLEEFLENEKNNNDSESWCKLNKTIKLQKIKTYVEQYKVDHKLTDEDKNSLLLFLKDCLDKKKLMRVKDVVYDKENGTIMDIPALTFVKATKHFTLKNVEKRVSTLKSLSVKKKSAKNKEDA
jgi:hypothetical protein